MLEWSSGLFGQVSVIFDVVTLAMLTLLLLLTSSSQLGSAISRRLSKRTLLALFVGSALLLIANDLLSLMVGVAIMIWALAALEVNANPRSNSKNVSALAMSIIGWSLIFGGIAFLVASAAIARSAPHGLPGLTTTSFSELTSLIERSASQHPAAKFIWQQYQLVPTIALLIGVGILGGLFPTHSLFAETIENSTLPVRLWVLMMSKIALLHTYRLMIAADPTSWATTAELLTLPALFGFVYVSYLLYSAPNTATHLSRLIIWSQQFTLVCWTLLPQHAMAILWLNVVVQFSGMVLLCLVVQLAETTSDETIFIPKLIGTLSVGATSNTAGLLLIWDASLELSTTSTLGAAAFVLFAITLLISVAGMLTLLQRPLSTEGNSIRPLNVHEKATLACWSLIAIFVSFAILFF